MHVMGSQYLAEAMTRAARRPRATATRSSTTTRTSATRTRPTTRSSCRSSSEGEHLFTAVAKAHQADCGNALPTTYMPCARDVYEEGALIFPCVRVQRDFEDIDDIIRMCRRRIRVPEQWYGDYLADARRGAHRRARGSRSCARSTASDVIRDVIARVVRLQRAPHGAGDLASSRSGTLHGSSTHDPYPGLPRRHPAQRSTVTDRRRGRDGRARPARQPRQLPRRAQRVARVLDGELR